MNQVPPDSSVPQANILIVEDEQGPREALKIILSPYYNLYTVDRAEVAQQILSTHPIDLVTLDLKLPDVPGTDFLAKIRENGQDVDVVIITGYGTLQSAIDAIRHGVAAYILKPFNVSDLLETIKKALERRRRLWQTALPILDPGFFPLPAESFPEPQVRAWLCVFHSR